MRCGRPEGPARAVSALRRHCRRRRAERRPPDGSATSGPCTACGTPSPWPKAMGKADDVRRFEAEERAVPRGLGKTVGPANRPRAAAGSRRPSKRLCCGNHWDNMMLLYPEPLFDPFDPRVTATIRKSRETYAEGILGYVLPVAIGKKGGEFVFNTKPGLALLAHAGQRPKCPGARQRRGPDQRWPSTTSMPCCCTPTSTHAPQEFSTVPWSTRDYFTERYPARRGGLGKDHRADAKHAGSRVSGRPLPVLGRFARVVAAGEEDRNRGRTHDVSARSAPCFRPARTASTVKLFAPVPPAAQARGDSRALVLRGPGGRGRWPRACR